MIFTPAKARQAMAADQMFDLIEDALVVVNRDHAIVRFNRAAEKMFGWRAAEVLGQSLNLLIPERFHLQHTAQVDEFAAGAVTQRPMAARGRQIFGLRRDGDEFLANIQIMRLGKGRHAQMAALVRDASMESTSEEEIVRMAAVDPLTGAYNRREIGGIAEREALRAARYHHPLTVMLLDLDGLGAINAAQGVAFGDTVLQTFSDMCAHTLRSVDVLGRWSDNEFIVLLPETPLDGAQIIADRLRRQTATLTFGGVADVRVTVSIGLTQYRDSEVALEGAMARAEGALTEAKRGGRNRIAVRKA